jgi:hypothetical protein
MVLCYLDSFIVDHGIDCNSSRAVVSGIGLLPELCPPRCREDGKGRVSSHGCASDHGKLPAILVGLALLATLHILA